MLDGDVAAAAFADTMAPHQRVNRADPRAVGDAAAVVALTSDRSMLTSVANDYACDRVVARQIEAHGRDGRAVDWQADLVERFFVDR